MRVAELANPSRFLRAANLAIPWLGGATLLLFAFALYRAVLAPDDYQQGATVKIMFLHVPSAWLGMLCWALMMIAARRQSITWWNANERLVLVNSAEIAMIGTTGSAPTIGTSTSGISAPVP